MTPETSKAIAAFRALHVPGDPLILVNIWDAGSARAVAAAGARAIATGSFGVAGAQGRNDGEDFPLDDALANLTRILSVTDLPVTIDMESGYGSDPAAVAFEAVEHAMKEGYDLVFVDTAGRLQTKHNLMEELKKINRVLGKKLDGAQIGRASCRERVLERV